MLELAGRFSLVLRDKSGKVKHQEKGRNLVTDLGEQLAADLFATTPVQPSVEYLTLGSGTDTPLKTDTGLQTQIDASDTQHTGAGGVRTLNQVAWAFTVTGPVAASWDVNEVGIFNDDYLVGARWLVARFLSQPFTMYPGDELDVTWTLEFLGVG